MKTKYPSIFGLLAAVLLVLSFVMPASIATPAAADPGICKWDTLVTPNYLPLKNDVGLYAPHDMAIGGDSSTVLITARYALPEILPSVPTTGAVYNALFYSNNNGISFAGTKYNTFASAYWQLNIIPYSPTPAPNRQWPQVYQVAIAPDNPNFWAIVTDANQGNVNPLVNSPLEVWVTANAGGKWECTNFGNFLAGKLITDERIRCIDISVDYGGKRDLAVGTANGAGGGDVYVVPSTGFAGWKKQLFDTGATNVSGDFYALKFSPTYASDASLALVYATLDVSGATFYNISLRDIDLNEHQQWAFGGAIVGSIEVKDTNWGPSCSPAINQLNTAELELPSDFSGQAASLRRAYISLDAWTGSTKIFDCTNAAAARDGIFRIDDATVYTLMDTSNVTQKSIYSIAYFGTYASGKLLAGERRGDSCTAQVPTWFTDSPTTCPIPCWYPALKPTTGAAGWSYGATDCGGYLNGGALVGWKADGNLAFAVTGSFPTVPTTAAAGPWYKNWVSASTAGMNALRLYDESAFAISRNNGETWNQIALINTSVDNFTDIAPTPDCKTVYLASVNKTDTSATLLALPPFSQACAGFDSVWRTSSNMDVVAPYPALPVGTFWERVLTKRTADNCTAGQTNAALLRIVPYCADPTGQIVAWGVYDTGKLFKHGIAAWSPDFGDYWANITVRDPIQDFTFESQTVMYFLSPSGSVQKMPYTGTAWATALPSVDTIIYGAHSIAAFPDGKVLVGANAAYHMVLYAVSYSLNFNTDNPTFTVQSTAGRTPFYGDVHVAFDPNFSDTNIYFINDENYTTYSGSVYRDNPQAQVRLVDSDMLAAVNGAVGCFTYGLPQTGLVLAFTGGALYSSTAGTAGTAAPAPENLVAVVTAALNPPPGGVDLTITTNAANVFFDFPGGPPTDCRVVGAMVPGVSATACCDVVGVANRHGSGTVQIVGATSGTIYATINLGTGAMIEGANTCETAVAGESSGVLRTIAADAKGNFGPLSGMPKPGIAWDNLTVGLERAPLGVKFTLQPTALKACGCCTLDTDTTLYAIDNSVGAYSSTDRPVLHLPLLGGYVLVAKTQQGMVWAFTDCMAKRGPALVTEDKALIGCDPVSGRAQEVNLCWEQLCVANAYDIEIGKNADFTIKIIDWVTENQCTGFLEPADLQTPCAYFPAGGEAFTLGSSIAAWGNLECGHTYYWRIKVRECATQQVIRSPWSEVRSFTVKAGLPVVSTYLGLTLLAPNNGCLACPVKPASFSWSPFKETTKYKFQLASDAGMTQLVKEAEVLNSTAFEYDGALEYSTNYFWRVMCMEPAPSDWSATFSFQTEAKPAEAAGAAPAAPTPLWVWVVIAIGAILVIVTLVLIFKTRRV
jgi:hypothetical protein